MRGSGVSGFGSVARDAGLVAGEDLRAVGVAAIGDGLECLRLQNAFACLATLASCARSEPLFVTSCVTIRVTAPGCLDRDLHVVADDTGAASRSSPWSASSGSVSETC